MAFSTGPVQARPTRVRHDPIRGLRSGFGLCGRRHHIGMDETGSGQLVLHLADEVADIGIAAATLPQVPNG